VTAPSPHGFRLLLGIGAIDNAARSGFLTFLPFLLQAKGASLTTIALALSLVLAGGAAGKLVCGYLGARLGVLTTVLLTEGSTAAGMVALLALPLDVVLIVLPLVGIALNGTSSVLYGTVPELVPPDACARSASGDVNEGGVDIWKGLCSGPDQLRGVDLNGSEGAGNEAYQHSC